MARFPTKRATILAHCKVCLREYLYFCCTYHASGATCVDCYVYLASVPQEYAHRLRLLAGRYTAYRELGARPVRIIRDNYSSPIGLSR